MLCPRVFIDHRVCFRDAGLHVSSRCVPVESCSLTPRFLRQIPRPRSRRSAVRGTCTNLRLFCGYLMPLCTVTIRRNRISHYSFSRASRSIAPRLAPSAQSTSSARCLYACAGSCYSVDAYHAARIQAPRLRHRCRTAMPATAAT